MKKNYLLALPLFLLLLLFAGTSLALPVSWDLNTLGYSGTNDGIVNFDELGLTGASLIIQNDDDGNGNLSVGDTFTEELIFYVNSVSPATGDDEGLNDLGGYEITGYLNLEGHITSVAPVLGTTLNVTYELTAGNLDMYFDNPPDFIIDPSSEIQLADGSDSSVLDNSNYTDGTLIASANLLTGIGTSLVNPAGGLPVYDQGSTNLNLEFTYLYKNGSDDDFWNFNGKGASEYPTGYKFFTLPSVDLDDTLTSVASNKTGAIFDASQTNDGSAVFSMVPEPTTMLLFGFGLLGLAGISRRKKD